MGARLKLRAPSGLHRSTFRPSLPTSPSSFPAPPLTDLPSPSRMPARLRSEDLAEASVMDQTPARRERPVLPRVSPSNSISTTTPAKAPIPQVSIPTGQLLRSRQSISHPRGSYYR